MAEYDLVSDIKIVEAIPILDHAAIVVGTEIDTQGFESVTFVFTTGTVGAGTADFTIDHAPDDGTGSAGVFAAVDAADLIGTTPTFVTASDNLVARLGYRGKQRHVRVSSVETATWTTHSHGVVCILGHPKTTPVTAQVGP